MRPRRQLPLTERPARGHLAANVTDDAPAALNFALAATLIGGALALGSVSQAGALAFVPCASSAGFICATLPVPLDRSGGVPGTSR